MEWLSKHSSKHAVQSVIDRLKENHGINYVTSINVVGRLSPWTLSPCCGSQTPLTTSPPWSTVTPVVNHRSSTVTPVVDTGTSDITITSISTTDTSPIIPRNETQGELIELKVNPFNMPRLGIFWVKLILKWTFQNISYCH